MPEGCRDGVCPVRLGVVPGRWGELGTDSRTASRSPTAEPVLSGGLWGGKVLAD
ncbi:hypothetical protein NRF20_26885 [Streptomyces sp. R-74717]|uniref:hypothetical protein n=1 Tax=Streptomyces TaxID=1883 RepID=UPI0037A36EEB